MGSQVERHRRVYRKVVIASVTASAVIHAAVLGLVRINVELPEGTPTELRRFTPAEPARQMQVVTLQPEAPQPTIAESQPTTRAQASAPQASSSDAVAAPSVASESARAVAPALELSTPDLRRAPAVQNVALGLDTPGREIVAQDVRATVPTSEVGGSDDEEEEDGGGGGIKGLLDGIGGILGGVKISGGMGGDGTGGAGGKGGCVPGIGGIIGGRQPGGTSIPQRPAVGPRGIGGRGGPPMSYQHSESGCGATR